MIVLSPNSHENSSFLSDTHLVECLKEAASVLIRRPKSVWSSWIDNPLNEQWLTNFGWGGCLEWRRRFDKEEDYKLAPVFDEVWSQRRRSWGRGSMTAWPQDLPKPYRMVYDKDEPVTTRSDRHPSVLAYRNWYMATNADGWTNRGPPPWWPSRSDDELELELE